MWPEEVRSLGDFCCPDSVKSWGAPAWPQVVPQLLDIHDVPWEFIHVHSRFTLEGVPVNDKRRTATHISHSFVDPANEGGDLEAAVVGWIIYWVRNTVPNTHDKVLSGSGRC